jgi:DNA-binding Lrp family transcriptional regulator
MEGMSPCLPPEGRFLICGARDIVTSLYLSGAPGPGRRMRAFVLVKVTMGKERETIDAFQSIAGLEEINFLFGDYDYIVTLQAADTVTMARVIRNRIRKVPGVVQTITMIEAPL